jgi:thiazole/oxazole-forming peptide maturase SagD family component
VGIPERLHFLELDRGKPEVRDILETGLLSSPALKSVVPKMDRLFLVRSDFAPGGRFLAGQARVKSPGHAELIVNTIGGGLSLPQSVQSCLGEAAERLSILDADPKIMTWLSLGDFAREAPEDLAELVLKAAHARGLAAGTDIACLAGQDPETGERVFIPAEWCCQSGDFGPSLANRGQPKSIGVAAGFSDQDAARRAILELIERDAIALWWLGGRRPKGFALEGQPMARAVATIGQFRQSSAERQTWLLDITTNLLIPCVVALSADRNLGDVCVGSAARLTFEAAIEAAIVELCQAEIGLEIALQRQARDGEKALTPDDRILLDRANTLTDPDDRMDLLAHDPYRANLEPLPHLSELDELIAHLRHRGIRVYLLKQDRRDLSIPVMRAIAPSLQPYPSADAGLVRDRLLRVCGERQSNPQWFSRRQIL